MCSIRRRLNASFVLWISVLAFSAASGRGQEPSPAAPPEPAELPRPRLTISRVEGHQIRVDGVLDEGTWQSPGQPIPYETQPGDNLPAKVGSEFWIAYDQNHLYVAYRLTDPEPLAVRASLRDRDRAYQDDWVGLVIDPFNDERRGFEFLVNPFGVQMDLARNDNTGEEDDSWDTLWYSAGRLTATGYEVEMEIPFSSLRFPAASDPMTWGLDVWRNYPREKRYLFGWAPGRRGANCYFCRIGKMDGIEGVSPSRNLEFDPTFTASATERRDPATDDFERQDDSEPGLSARWGVTPNFTLNAAINPDFSQVEADVAQLDVNTRFALFYPEKRPFFLEGADIFGTRINALYSRNIADPDWGMKLTGKQGRHALGVIVAEDAITNILLPSPRGSGGTSLADDNLSSMLRYRFDIGGSSTAGLIYSGREGSDYRNNMVGADTLFRWRGSEAFRVEFLTSATRYPAALAAALGMPQGDFDGEALRVAYQHDDRAWTVGAVGLDIDDGFRADLGFIPQVGFRGIDTFADRRWYFTGPTGEWLNQITVHGDYAEREDQAGNLLSHNANLSTQLRGRGQSFLHMRVGTGEQTFQGRRFDDNSWGFFYEGVPARGVELRLDGRFGDRVDFFHAQQAHEDFLAPGVSLDLGRHLRVTLDHAWSDTSVDRGGLFTAELSQLRATYQFNVRAFIRLVSIYERIERNLENWEQPFAETDEVLNNQFLFSYKLNPQTVLFLGYSDAHNSELAISPSPNLGDPSGLRQQGRTLFLKVGYAWLL